MVYLTSWTYRSLKYRSTLKLYSMWIENRNLIFVERSDIYFLIYCGKIRYFSQEKLLSLNTTARSLLNRGWNWRWCAGDMFLSSVSISLNMSELTAATWLWAASVSSLLNSLFLRGRGDRNKFVFLSDSLMSLINEKSSLKPHSKLIILHS